MKEKLVRKYIPTPLGRMILIASEKGICFLEFEKKDRNIMLEKRLVRWFNSPNIIDGSHEFIQKGEVWTDNYFQGKFQLLGFPPLDLRGTQFELSVWDALKSIPLGKTISYGEVAEKVAKPGAARAIGGIVGRNPISIIIPCHRVIGKNGSLTGYGGGIENKKWLLAHEIK